MSNNNSDENATDEAVELAHLLLEDEYKEAKYRHGQLIRKSERKRGRDQDTIIPPKPSRRDFFTEEKVAEALKVVKSIRKPKRVKVDDYVEFSSDEEPSDADTLCSSSSESTSSSELSDDFLECDEEDDSESSESESEVEE